MDLVSSDVCDGAPQCPLLVNWHPSKNSSVQSGPDNALEPPSSLESIVGHNGELFHSINLRAYIRANDIE